MQTTIYSIKTIRISGVIFFFTKPKSIVQVTVFNRYHRATLKVCVWGRGGWEGGVGGGWVGGGAD